MLGGCHVSLPQQSARILLVEFRLKPGASNNLAYLFQHVVQVRSPLE